MSEALATVPMPSLPERLTALGAEGWPLQPVPRDELRHLLRDEAGLLLDRLLVEVARGAGALAVAMGECLDALSSGDGAMRFGYSGIGDYARERLSMGGRTGQELARLARELRSRPLLRAAVRAGEVTARKAMAILSVARGEAEAEWVARARASTVRALAEAAGGGPEEEPRPERVDLALEPGDREVVDRALDAAGKELGAGAPTSQRVEALCQEYLGEHPVLAGDDGCGDGPGEAQAPAAAWSPGGAGQPDLRAWLEEEMGRWSFLHRTDPVSAPEAGADGLARARVIDARLQELADMRRGWDELLGHLCQLLISTGLWRDMGFADLGHYAAERLGLSARAMQQRAWLDRRMWDMPAIRRALRDGILGYEQARVVARCTWPEHVGVWIERAQGMTCIELIRAVQADEDRQMSARKTMRLLLPEPVARLFGDACRAVWAAEGRRLGPGECLRILAEHFLEVHAQRRTRARRVLERDRERCAVPGCSRAATHVHHVQYRSRGGGDEEENLISLCAAHHLHGVHRGYVRVSGRAPDGLKWVLGEA